MSRSTARQEQAGQALAKPASILRNKETTPHKREKHMAMNSGIDRKREKRQGHELKKGNELEKWTPKEKKRKTRKKCTGIWDQAKLTQKYP